MRSNRGWIVVVQPEGRGRTATGQLGHLTFTRTEARAWAKHLRALPDRVRLRARAVYVSAKHQRKEGS